MGAFMNAVAERGLLLVFVHLNAESLDEVSFAAQALGHPIVVATGLSEDQPTGLSLRGGLEPKQLQTLKRVASLGEADAKAAHEGIASHSAVGDQRRPSDYREAVWTRLDAACQLFIERFLFALSKGTRLLKSPRLEVVDDPGSKVLRSGPVWRL